MSSSESPTVSDQQAETSLSSSQDGKQAEGLRKRNNADAATPTPAPEPQKERIKPSFPTLENFKEVLKQPELAPAVFFRTLGAISELVQPGGGLTLFLVTWLPLLLSGFGSVIGFLFSARGISFLLGAAGAFATLQIFKQIGQGNADSTFDKALVVWTFIPMFMLETSGWLLPIFLMIAASGAPYVLNAMKYSPSFENARYPILALNVAAVVTYGVSAGGSGIVNSVLLAGLYTGAGYIIPFIPADALEQVKKLPVHQYIDHPGLIQVVLQTIIAKVILYFLYGLILPGFLFETQNNIFFDIIYTAIGFGVLGAGLYLTKAGDAKQKLIYVAALFASYVLILLTLVFQEVTLVVVA